MYKNDNTFDNWNNLKKTLNRNSSYIGFSQFEIIFMKIGANIGFEQDGKGKEYLRPILVYKKFNNRVFLGIPLTSKIKKDKFHYEFEYKKGKKSFAILSQLRLFDIKRVKYKDGKISKTNFIKLQNKLQQLIVTPLQEEGERTKAICKGIISNNSTNVNILITGSKGQLGSEIKELSANYDYNFFFKDKKSLDITNPHAISEFIKLNNINTIINCAAYTAVDRAEEEQELADSINHKALKYLAQISKDKNIKLIHISTDYVFDGKNHLPYKEDDTTNPTGIYAKTKLDGEQVMQDINPKNSTIIRTSWVYSSFGANFVKTMLRLAQEKKELSVIFDQIGTPTYARDLATTILEIVPNIKNEKVEIYHYSNEGVLSWYDFAKEIMRMSKSTCQINPIESKEYPTPAKRPHYSLLNKSKIKKEFKIEIPFWKDSLDECLKKMGERR